MKMVGIVVVWSVATGITIPYTISQGLIGDTICIDIGVLSILARNIYVTSWIVTGWGIPFLVIGTIYALCSRNLKKTPKGNSNRAAIRRRQSENQRVVKMFIIIVSLFFALTTPYSVMYVTYNYVLTYHTNEVDINSMMKWNYALFTITNINSCLNPIIYAKLHKDINQFVNKFCNCRSRNESSSRNTFEITDVSSQSKFTQSSRSAATSSSNKAFDQIE